MTISTPPARAGVATEAAATGEAPQSLPALLSADRAVVVEDGHVAWDGMSFRLEGARIGLLGDAGPLFRVLGRKAEVSRGALSILGEPAESAVVRGAVGLALHQSRMGGTLTCLQYLADSAFLLGIAEPELSARRRLSEFYLDWLANKRLAHLSPLETRALSIASASLGEPRLLALELVLGDLTPSEQDWLAELVQRALRPGQAALVSARSTTLLGAERRLLETMDSVYRLSASGASRVDLSLEVATSRYLVVLGERGDDYLEALAQAQVTAEWASPLELTPHGRRRLIVALADPGDPRILVETAVALDIPLYELTPWVERGPV